MEKEEKERDEILVIDDDSEASEILAELLSRKGYTVARAENGRQALDYLTHAKPGLIILDLMMPEMSGWEFRERQQNDPRLRSIPVVVVTASGLVENVEADAVLSKPLDFGCLMRVVERNIAHP